MNDLTLYHTNRQRIINNGTGGLILWASDASLGDAIQALGPTQSKLLPEPVNHASCILIMNGIKTARVFNYESLSNGFQPHFLRRELESYNGRVYWAPLKKGINQFEIEERMFEFDSTPYGFRELVLFPVKRPDIETDTMICSESVEVVVTGNLTGKVHAPGELPDLGYWEQEIIRIL
jgi:hypothetical protein